MQDTGFRLFEQEADVHVCKSFAMDLVTDKLVSSFDIITIFLDVIKAFSADFWNCVYTSGPKISTSAHLNSPFPYKINNPKNLTTTGKIHIFSNPILLQLYSKYASYTITRVIPDLVNSDCSQK